MDWLFRGPCLIFVVSVPGDRQAGDRRYSDKETCRVGEVLANGSFPEGGCRRDRHDGE